MRVAVPFERWGTNQSRSIGRHRVNRLRAVVVATVLLLVCVLATSQAPSVSAQDYPPRVQATDEVKAEQITASDQAPLARTGTSSTVPLAQLAVVLVATGGLLVLAARRRSAPHAVRR